MPEILIFPRHQAVPTHGRGAFRGREIRVTTHSRFGFLPAWRCQSFSKGIFYLCGKCFGKRGDGPATSSEELWVAAGYNPATDRFDESVVPATARCEDCGGRAWPK